MAFKIKDGVRIGLTDVFNNTAETLNLKVKDTNAGTGKVSITTASLGSSTYTQTLQAATGTIALTSQIPTVNDASLTLTVGEDGTTGNSVYITTGTGFTANDTTNTTYDIHVGPSLSALADIMTGATTGFLKKTAQDTYILDTNAYLTSQSNDFGNVKIDNTDTEYTWAVTDGTTTVADTLADTLTVVAAKTGSTVGIQVKVDTALDAIGIAHADTSTLSGQQGTAGISSITLDEMGHITAVGTATYLTSQNNDFGTFAIGTDSGYTWGAANTNTSQVADSIGDTLTLVRGLTGSTAGIDLFTSTVAGTDAIKIAHADTSTLSGLQGGNGISSITVDEMGHITAVGTATYLTTQKTSKNIVGASSTATADATATNGNVYLNHLEDTTVTSAHKITGAGGTTVTSDASGNITITSTDTNTDTLQSIADDTANADRFITTVANATGAQTGFSHSTLKYNPSTETLKVTNLIVSGTSTTVNTETINLADNIVVFNSNATGTPTENAGIEIERGDSANKTLIWDESADKWTVGAETFVSGAIETDVVVLGGKIRRSVVTGTLSANTATAIDTWATGTYRSAVYQIQLTQGTKYQFGEVRVVHDGTSTYITEFAVLENSVIGTGTQPTFTATIATGTLSFNILVDNAATTNVAYIIEKKLFTV